jgi:hypothetical protein
MKKREYTTVLIDFKDISLAHYCINKSMTKAEFSFTLRDMKLSMREEGVRKSKKWSWTSLGIPTFIFTLYSSTIFS